MTLDDQPAFVALIDRLYATWGKPRPPARLTDAAWDALEDFAFDIVQTAITARIFAGGRFMPSTADIRDECVLQRRAQHTAHGLTFNTPACERCDGFGQVVTRHETHTYATTGHEAWSKTLSFWSPCSCERGQQLQRNRTKARSQGAA